MARAEVGHIRHSSGSSVMDCYYCHHTLSRVTLSRVTCHAASAGCWLPVIVAGLLGIISLTVRFRDYFPAPSEYQTGTGSVSHVAG